MLTNDECWGALAEKGTGQRFRPSAGDGAAAHNGITTAGRLCPPCQKPARSQIEGRDASSQLTRTIALMPKSMHFADGRRAGLDEKAIDLPVLWRTTPAIYPLRKWPEFARKMTSSASVTDGEFAELVKHYGEKTVAAMVLTMAYANFQDRVLLCLGSPLEADGPLPPLDVVLRRGRTGAPPCRRSRPENLIDFEIGSAQPPPAMSFRMTRSGQASHLKNCSNDSSGSDKRSTRVRVPEWEEVDGSLPISRLAIGLSGTWSGLGLVPRCWPPRGKPICEPLRSRTATRSTAFSVRACSTALGELPLLYGPLRDNSPVWPGRKSHVEPACFRRRLVRTLPEEQRAYAFARKPTSKPAEISLTSTVSSTTSARIAGSSFWWRPAVATT